MAAPAMAAADPRPNILLILSDDHSAPYLGCYGDPVIRTPNLDRFASEGMRFERAFTAAPQCVPSRAAIVTGRSPVAARIARFSSPLPPEVVTLPELLRQNGYFTGICRRNFHLDGPAVLPPATREIFEKHSMRTFDQRVDWLDRNSPRSQTVAKFNEFLDKRPASKPFFLWMSFNDPHHVWDRNAIPVPHDPAKLKLPRHLPDLPGMRDDLGRYFDEIARMDGEFQSVMDVLARRGARDNTIVVFMGDNGMAFPHGKGSLYDPGLNVPLLVRWPGQVKAGSVTRELISGEDITPTLLAAAGVAPERHMTGQSFHNLLRGRPYEGRKHIFAARGVHGNTSFNEKTRSSNFDLSRSVRSDRYKLIYNLTPWMEYQPVDSANDAGWRETVAAHKAGTLDAALSKTYFSRPRPIVELYDLERDPSELNNLAGTAELAETERQLKLALQEKMIVDYDFLPLPTNE